MKQIKAIRAIGLVAFLGLPPLYATVTIESMTPSVKSPQLLGTLVVWTVKATDSNASDNLTFQFSVASGSGPFALVRDYNIGTLSSGVWTSQPFPWTTIAGEGNYTIQVIAKDFTSGETATKTQQFYLQSRISTGVAVVYGTLNPLVALFSAPVCPSGSTMRVASYPSTNTSFVNYTNWVPCSGTASTNIYVAGMLPSTSYSMYSQTATNGTVTNGSTLTFTTRALPNRTPTGFFPTFSLTTPAPSNDPNPMLLWSFTKVIVPVATDLNGNIMWYYGAGAGTLLTRPVPNSGTMLTIQNGLSWDSSNQFQQMLREIDLAGNIVHETNTGIIANQLVALGYTDGTPCGQITLPAQIGDGCLNDFHHDAIRLPNGYTAFLAHVEKLFPPGTQGAPGSSPVDVLSEMVIVLDTNWQVNWAYDAFTQLNINRTAPLGETCSAGASDCPTKLFLGTQCDDWTHANSVDYVSSKQSVDYGDFLVSMRNQDQVIRIKYQNGAGSCLPTAPNCIAWYMGPPDDVTPSNFAFNNVSNDPWPWFSHQHDVTYVNGGKPVTIDGLTGPLLTIFDNGNTRFSTGPLGLGSNCAPSDCNSRGMALFVDEATMKVTPVLLQDLGTPSTALGGAQALTNGNYFFQPGIPSTQAIELQPTTGVLGIQVVNLGSVDYSYRGWQMPNIYNPPIL